MRVANDDVAVDVDGAEDGGAGKGGTYCGPNDDVRLE